MPAERTYLDWNATAPLRPEARAAMIAALDVVGNASSVHMEGRRARGLVESAREQVAALIGAQPAEVVLTAGATEANNWAVRAGWDNLVVGGTEHESVLAPARAADPELVELPCDGDGLVAADRVEPFMGPRRASDGPDAGVRKSVEPDHRHQQRNLLSLQLANSETGVIQPIAAAARAATAGGWSVHCDAVQAAGRIPLDFRALGLDLMSVSSHKLGGPKGVGALVIREGFDLPPLLAGGGQERRRRAGTENVAAIAGFGAAAAAASRDLQGMAAVLRLRDRLEAGVREITPEAVIIGAGAPRLPNTSCVALAGAQAATLLIKLDLAGIAVSAGSACSSGRIGGSHVLAAMHIDRRLAAGAIRVSLGHATTCKDIDLFLAQWRAIHRGDVRNLGGDNQWRQQASQIEARHRVTVSDPKGPTPPPAGE